MTTLGLSEKSPQLKGGVWQHFVGVRDGTKVILYLNGEVSIEEEDIPEAPFKPATDNFRIGSGVKDDRPFNGIVDEAFVFKRSLSKDEIAEVMNRGLANIVFAVSPAGKLATAWGNVKGLY